MKISLSMTIIFLLAFWCLAASGADLAEGMKAFQSAQYSKALQILVPLANAGDNVAQRIIGEMCYNGQGMKRDVVASYKWSEIAAEGGDKVAQYNLGYLYEKGDGVVASRNLAIGWYTKAAFQGHIAAQHKLGDLYYSSDRDKAIYWYKKASESGDEVARREYATLSSTRVKDLAETEHLNALKNKQKDDEERRVEDERRLTAQRNQDSSSSSTNTGLSIMQGIGDAFNQQKKLGKIQNDTMQDINRAAQEKQAQADADRRAAAERRAQESERIRQQNQARREQEQGRLQKQARLQDQERQQKQARLQEQERQQEQARQQEQSRKQEQARKREQERKKAEDAAAKLAEEKAEKQAKAQAEKDYLKNIAAGIKLVATKCPDGQGIYYATGTMPKIRPEVVGCVDVYYRAYCPGNARYSSGIAKNFLGMSGCFGDTYDIVPKPPCKVDQVRIEVIKVVPGCK